MHSVGLICEDAHLYRLFSLLLEDVGEKLSLPLFPYPITPKSPLQEGTVLVISLGERGEFPCPVISVGDGLSLPFPFKREDFMQKVLACLRSEKEEAEAKFTLKSADASLFFPQLGTVHFTPREWAILEQLLSGEPVKREALLGLFPQGTPNTELNVYMHRLRRKLEKDGVKRLFSLHGQGYRLDLPLNEEKEERHATTDSR